MHLSQYHLYKIIAYKLYTNLQLNQNVCHFKFTVADHGSSFHIVCGILWKRANPLYSRPILEIPVALKSITSHTSSRGLLPKYRWVINGGNTWRMGPINIIIECWIMPNAWHFATISKICFIRISLRFVYKVLVDNNYSQIWNILQ